MNGLAASSSRRKSKRAGYGGIAAASRATGLARSTIGRGLKHLADPGSMSGKIRRPGSGQPTLVRTDPGLLKSLRRLLEPATMGDPMRPLLWVSKIHAKLAAALRDMGHKIGKSSIAKQRGLLKYSRQVNRKTLEGSRDPDRDALARHGRRVHRRSPIKHRSRTARQAPRSVRPNTHQMPKILEEDFARARSAWRAPVPCSCKPATSVPAHPCPCRWTRSARGACHWKYQKYCMIPRTRNTRPWAFMNFLRASLRYLPLAEASVCPIASPANRALAMA